MFVSHTKNHVRTCSLVATENWALSRRVRCETLLCNQVTCANTETLLACLEAW